MLWPVLPELSQQEPCPLHSFMETLVKSSVRIWPAQSWPPFQRDVPRSRLQCQGPQCWKEMSLMAVLIGRQGKGSPIGHQSAGTGSASRSSEGARSDSAWLSLPSAVGRSVSVFSKERRQWPLPCAILCCQQSKMEDMASPSSAGGPHGHHGGQRRLD